MNLAQSARSLYPLEWRFLQAAGWTIEPVVFRGGTARVNSSLRRIEVSPRVFRSPGVRHRQYVLRHEIWHAIHFEVARWSCDDLCLDRDLRLRDAVEVVADAACLLTVPGRLMVGWVRSSVIWHGRVGYRYRWSDVVSGEARQVVSSLAGVVGTVLV